MLVLQGLSALPGDSIATCISHSLTWLMYFENRLPTWRLTGCLSVIIKKSHFSLLLLLLVLMNAAAVFCTQNMLHQGHCLCSSRFPLLTKASLNACCMNAGAGEEQGFYRQRFCRSSGHLFEDLGYPFGPPALPSWQHHPACVMHKYCLFCSTRAFVSFDLYRLCLQLLSPVHLQFSSYSKGPTACW